MDGVIEQLSWELRVDDQSSSPLRRIYDESRRTEDEVIKLRGEMGKLSDELSHMTKGDGAQGIAEMGAGVAGWLEVFDAVSEKAGDIVAKVRTVASEMMQLGTRVVKDRDNALRTLSFVTGSDDEASRIFDKYDAISRRHAQSVQAYVGMFKQGKAFGFSSGETDLIIGLANDLQAANGTGERGMEQAFSTIMRLNKGKLDFREMTRIADLGVNLDTLKGELATIRHESLDQLNAHLGKGGIDGRDAIQAMLATMKRQGGQAESGALAELLDRNNLDVQKSRLTGILEDYFQKGDNSPMIRFYRTLGDLLDSTTPAGERLQTSISTVFSSVMSWVDLVAKDGRLADWIDQGSKLFVSVLDTVGDLIGAGRDFFGGFKDGFDALTPAIDGLRRGLGILDDENNRGKVNWREVGLVVGHVAGGMIHLATAIGSVVAKLLELIEAGKRFASTGVVGGVLKGVGATSKLLGGGDMAASFAGSELAKLGAGGGAAPALHGGSGVSFEPGEGKRIDRGSAQSGQGPEPPFQLPEQPFTVNDLPVTAKSLQDQATTKQFTVNVGGITIQNPKDPVDAEVHAAVESKMNELGRAGLLRW